MKNIASASFAILSIAFLGFPGLGDLSSLSGGKMASRISAGSDLVKAATLDDKDIQTYAAQYAAYSDKTSKIAPAGSSYAQRLEKLTSGLKGEDGLKINFKAYINSEVNAFSLADGSIRINSGLLDLMSDDEVLSVIGHEIGHVKLGHAKSQFRTAYLASAARKGAASATGKAGALIGSELGGLGESLVKAQFSQSNEKDADDYGLQFMKRHHFKAEAAVSALTKLSGLGNKSSIFSSHPDSKSRAARLDAELKG